MEEAQTQYPDALDDQQEISQAVEALTANLRPTLLCLSHLRWGFVYQRPQHLMSRFTQDYQVLFFEEPLRSDRSDAWLEEQVQASGVKVLIPHVPTGLTAEAVIQLQRQLIDTYLAAHPPLELLLWYFTPMSLAFTEHLQAQVTVFDCMDELSAFKGAPPDLLEKERQLLERADVVFTGGYSLWEAKRGQHGNVHPMPSSVDVEHFAKARTITVEPADQRAIAHPRLGFFGVIDERFDSELLAGLAVEYPHWQFVLIGPVVKIDPACLPRMSNIHYLGGKDYAQLPDYLSGWDVALMPFAINESTRFISPTKTPEYLAGGCPVVSTPIIDVGRMYGNSPVVRIAGAAEDFASAIKAALADRSDLQTLYRHADEALEGKSWDHTWTQIKEQIACLK
ncbi:MULTISPECIES: glycosyltransferase family 1 protein [unclassified Pseudomonas]|uniref:glycosyltransferase family 1 protein n=1 Tax=unclassified Pseudomonas TaxID=196821 RepID=UPI002AC97A36|nr:MULTISPECIES: glycosyltransferase family 1 protein [unclassified Pseudomonas]MEB0039995.1 glycosyltransferase family 1 protein [Pseudomonas sp. MH10]MEB0119520.1 glycosyltransferase family 1 protein [Pseudomonas sp. CCI1.2]WPX65129.1 glycosyltransferase family 1 protein [Pseudomonas sp. MH10]